MRVHDPMSEDSRTWGMASHLSALAGYVVPIFGNILGPLLVWYAKRKGDPYVDEQGKEALNFQISWSIWMAAAFFFRSLGIGLILLVAFVVADSILTIIAGVAARDGHHYRYPLTLRILH